MMSVGLKVEQHLLLFYYYFIIMENKIHDIFLVRPRRSKQEELVDRQRVI